MSITLGNLIDKTFYRIAQDISEAKAKLYRFHIESWTDDAINRLTEKVARSGAYPLLSKQFGNIALTSGVGQLDSNMFIESIPMNGEVLMVAGSVTQPCQFLPFIQDLKFGGRSLEWEYYTLTGRNSSGSGSAAIHVYKGNGSVSTATNVQIRCCYYPAKPADLTTAFSDLPVQLENDLTSMMVEVAIEKMKMMQSPEVAPSQVTA